MVVSRYHAQVTERMAVSARLTLSQAGLDVETDLLRAEAAGAFELPLLAKALCARDDIHCVLAFGLILKGQTDHDVHIATAVARGLMDVGLEARKPVLFGVLTCNSIEQAQERARTAEDDGLDKGREVALAAVRTLNALASIASSS